MRCVTWCCDEAREIGGPVEGICEWKMYVIAAAMAMECSSDSFFYVFESDLVLKGAPF